MFVAHDFDDYAEKEVNEVLENDLQSDEGVENYTQV